MLIIPQIERFAHIISFDTLLTSHLKEAISFMVSKADNLTGNDYVVICNSLLWNMVGDNLMDELAKWMPSNALMYSKVSGTKKSVGEVVDGIKVGNTFTSYVYQGNSITFMPDRALDWEYPEQAFGFILDLTPDLANGKPAIESWTFKGADMIKTDVKGVNKFILVQKFSCAA
nr:MAG TPA: hypothetical protein [Caudoviricetes sp.]